MPNCGALGCTNRSITHPEKSLHRLLSLFKKKEWATRGWGKLLPKELFICSGHVEPECYKRVLKVMFDFSEKNTSAILMRKVTTVDSTGICYFGKKVIIFEWMLFLILRVSYFESNLEEN